MKKNVIAALLLCSVLPFSMTGCLFGDDYVPEEETSAATEAVTEPSTEAETDFILPEGVVPLTWNPSPEHLMIDTDEARALYAQIKAGDYPSVEELKNSNVVAQIDAISAYYIHMYGDTSQIDTPEREQLRQKIKQEFLAIGSARTESTDPETGRHSYVYDGELAADYQMELVLGLPASGKSTRVTDPDSEEQKAFIIDCDVIKELIPEFQESHGGAADAVHFESMNLMNEAIQEFLTGSMKGTNVIIPLVEGDFDDLMENYIKPFEEAGYHVSAKFVPCEENASAARNVMRELETGRVINSAVAFSFGQKPLEVYQKLAPMENAFGVPYGVTILTADGSAVLETTEAETTEETAAPETEESAAAEETAVSEAEETVETTEAAAETEAESSIPNITQETAAEETALAA